MYVRLSTPALSEAAHPKTGRLDPALRAEARFGAVPDPVRRVVSAEKDLARMSYWLRDIWQA